MAYCEKATRALGVGAVAYFLAASVSCAIEMLALINQSNVFDLMLRQKGHPKDIPLGWLSEQVSMPLAYVHTAKRFDLQKPVKSQ